jgi:hypothetical protein
MQAVSRAVKKCRTVAAALTNHAWVQDITSVLNIPVIVQYIKLRQRLQQAQVNQGTTDVFW